MSVIPLQKCFSILDHIENIFFWKGSKPDNRKTFSFDEKKKNVNTSILSSSELLVIIWLAHIRSDSTQPPLQYNPDTMNAAGSVSATV